MITWTLEQGLKAARVVEAVAVAHGFHCALAGSVLHKGGSEKDLDIIVYPHKTTNPLNCIGDVIDALTLAGFTGWDKRDHGYQGDTKTVFKTEYLGGRVDFIFLQ